MSTTTTNWKNVNNWHWVDKNCLPWAKQYFTQKLSPLTLTHNDITIQITNVKKVEGDCDLNQRKGQIIHIFDLQLTLEFIGTKGNVELKGTIDIPEFMHDTKITDIVFDISIEGQSPHKDTVKEVVRTNFSTILRNEFKSFHADLMDAHSKDVYISNEDMVGHPVNNTYKPKPPVAAMAVEPTKGQAIGGLVSIKQEVEFQCREKDLFDTLFDRQRVQLWTRAPADIQPVEGSNFVLFGGNITGSITSITPTNIEMKWRVKSWPSEHHSNVKIELYQKNDCTVLVLKQDKVPVGEKSATEANWNNYYWNSIKRTFGFGAIL